MTKSIHPLKPLIAVALAVTVLATPTRAIEQWQIDVGYQTLTDALGGSTPVAAGVAVSQVEASGGAEGPYFPATGIDEFIAATDPLGQDVTFYDGSGFMANGISGHATDTVGRYMYGNARSLAKGASTVVVYEANRWLDQQLHIHSNTLAPERALYQVAPAQQVLFKVQNHSWVGTFSPSNPNLDLAALRRYDYVIETDDVTAVVGANNNPLSGIPNPAAGHPSLFAHSYNAIVVGRTDSRHSRGATTATYGAGRYRPDLVSSAESTSSATAQMSGAAALLRGAVAGDAAGDRSEPIKAMLLAGATKTEFAGFVEPSTSVANPWNRTSTRPLDDIFGAGELNIYNSYLMTVGGQHAGATSQPAAPVASYGWDYQDRKTDAGVGDMYYNFEIPSGSTASELSIILAWNAKVVDSNPSPAVFTPQESLQNLDLTLYNSTASFLGSHIDHSISTVDNVEHIYQTNLGPGTYTLKVTGAANWDYGLAWRMSTAFDVADADFDGDGFAGGGDFLAWQRNLGKLVGATNAEGDADGDGDVDRIDLTLLTTAIANQNAPPMVLNAVAAIPEPATLGAAAMAAAFLALAGRAARRRIA